MLADSGARIVLVSEPSALALDTDVERLAVGAPPTTPIPTSTPTTP